MCIKYSIIKYIDTATHSSGCFSMCRIKKGIVSGQRKASKSLMRNWKFANRSRHWCCPPVPLPAFPYTSIAQFLALGQLGASSLSRAIKSPTMVSGQWEVNSRHWGEVEEFLPEEELASMPSHHHPPLFLLGHRRSAAGDRSSLLAPFTCQAGHTDKCHSPRMAQGRTEGAWVPTVTLRAPHQPWTHSLLQDNNTGLPWLICHKLSLRVDATKHFPNFSTKGRLKTFC